MPTYRDLFRTPWGWMAAAYTDRGLRRLILPVGNRAEALSLLRRRCPEARKAKAWLRLRRMMAEYFGGERRSLNLPLDLPLSSAFTDRVRKVVRGVPFGEAATYGEVAERAGSPGAARAVGRVMNRNPVPLFIPCHRVVAAAGIGGFASGTALKRKLHDLEQRGKRK